MSTPQVDISSEQINDIPLLLGIMEGMGIRQQIDSQMERHGGWEGISIGTIVEIWLSYMLTERDHRLVAVREWGQARQQTLNDLLGIALRATDLSDDRLARVLTHLGNERVQRRIDAVLVHDWVTVYALPTETIRLDSTSVSVYSEIEDETGLIQRGHSKDHRPDLGQFKVMLSTLDPLGMPLNCAVVGGQRADDPLYIPIYDQTVQTLGRRDVLVVGDSKMAALDTRGHIVAGGSAYLCAYRPLGQSTDLPNWIEDALAHQADWQTITEADATTGELQTVAAIYEWIRPQTWWNPNADQLYEWTERVLVVRSEQMRQGLIRKAQERLTRLTQALNDLRRPAERGRKRYRTKAALRTKVENLLKTTEMTGLVNVTLTEESLANGTRRWIVSSFALDPAAWAAHLERLGWHIYLTNTTPVQYDASALLWHYRHQVLHERSFSRFKTRHLNIRPVFLRDEQRLVGLTWLLCLALRVLTLTEFRVRTALQAHHETLVGLNPAARSQATTQPTTERILQVFSNLTRTFVRMEAHFIRHVTELSPIQRQVLALLNLPDDLYARLATQAPTPLAKLGTSSA
jgi:transposase